MAEEQFLKATDEVNDIYFNAEEKLRLAIRNHVEWRRFTLEPLPPTVEYAEPR
jgi:hypothetical protein